VMFLGLVVIRSLDGQGLWPELCVKAIQEPPK
jgi:hypothetical protein